MWFRRKERRARTLDCDVQLIVETEAFLSGRILTYLRRAGCPVPGWARLNAFAHGDFHRIQQVRRTCDANPGLPNGWQGEVWAVPDPLEDSWRAGLLEEDAWRRAERVLVDEILALADGDLEKLHCIQRRTLVPLELRLIEMEAREGLTAFDLVRCTRAALRSSTS